MSNKNGKAKCPNCGKKIDTQAAVCPFCGSETALESADVSKRNIPLTIVKVFFSCFSSVLFIAFTSVLAQLIFMKQAAGSMNFPSVGVIKGRGLTELAGSWLPITFISLFVGISVLLLMVINVSRIRNVFLYAGISFIVVSLVCITIGVSEQYVVKYFAKELQSLLSYISADLFRFEMICAVAALAAGLVCILIFSITAAVKKSSREKKDIQQESWQCPSCGAAVEPGAAFCNVCGLPFVEAPMQGAVKLCPRCGNACGADKAFCVKCGTKLDNLF